MSEYAMSLSYSMVDNGEEVEAGFNAKSTEGLDVDILVSGDDREEVTKVLLSEAVEEIVDQTLIKPLLTSEDEESTRDEPISLEALQLENEQLRDEISYLREWLGEDAFAAATIDRIFDDFDDDDDDDEDDFPTTCACDDEKGNQETTCSKEDLFACFDDLDIDDDVLKLIAKTFGLI